MHQDERAQQKQTHQQYHDGGQTIPGAILRDEPPQGGKRPQSRQYLHQAFAVIGLGMLFDNAVLVLLVIRY
jgi:hypothetical protein